MVDIQRTTLAQTRPIPRLGLSRNELAIAIGVSPGTVDRMVEEGALPAPRQWHTRYVFLIDDVLTAMQAWPTKDGKTEKTGPDASGSDDQWRAVL